MYVNILFGMYMYMYLKFIIFILRVCFLLNMRKKGTELIITEVCTCRISYIYYYYNYAPSIQALTFKHRKDGQIR